MEKRCENWLSHKRKHNCFVKVNELTKVNLLNLINNKRHDLIQLTG